MSAPTIFSRRKANHEAIAAHGESLGFPDPDLVAQGRAYGERVRLNRSKKFKMAPNPKDPNGREIALDWALGEIGAELLARRLGTHTPWNDSGDTDGGVDLIVPAGYTVQVRTTRKYLLEKKTIGGVAYYAMVWYAGSYDTPEVLDCEYIFCGFITPEDFTQRQFPYDTQEHRRAAVTAAAMTLWPAQIPGVGD